MGKNKIWLMGSVLFAELGSSIFTFALSLSILAKTNSATAYSTVLVVGAVTSIILTPILLTAFLSERYSLGRSWSVLCPCLFLAFFSSGAGKSA